MKGVHFLLTVTVLAMATSITSAYDPSPLQDFCVAVDDPNKARKYYSFFFFSFLQLGGFLFVATCGRTKFYGN